MDGWRGKGRIGPKHLAAGIKVTDEGKERLDWEEGGEGEKGGRGRGKKREWLTGGGLVHRAPARPRHSFVDLFTCSLILTY